MNSKFKLRFLISNYNSKLKLVKVFRIKPGGNEKRNIIVVMGRQTCLKVIEKQDPPPCTYFCNKFNKQLTLICKKKYCNMHTYTERKFKILLPDEIEVVGRTNEISEKVFSCEGRYNN